jgi:hypothetical protein
MSKFSAQPPPEATAESAPILAVAMTKNNAIPTVLKMPLLNKDY